MDAITIVGGGIVGLALAATLDPDRFDVTVHEQRNVLPAVETSLAMWPQAQHALDSVGILPEIRAAGSAFEGMALRDAAGTAWLRAEVAGVIGVSRSRLPVKAAKALLIAGAINGVAICPAPVGGLSVAMRSMCICGMSRMRMTR